MIHHQSDCPGPHSIPLEFSLRQWGAIVDQLGANTKPGYLAIHLRDVHTISEDEEDAMLAATMGVSDPEMVGIMLSPWSLTKEVVATTLIDWTLKGTLYVTEIVQDGSYVTTRVDYTTTDEAYTFEEPEVDMHPWSWGQMELLKEAPRGTAPFDKAIVAATALIDTTMEEGRHG